LEFFGNCKKPTLTQIGKFHILAASRVKRKHRTGDGLCQKNESTIHVDGPAPGMSLASFLRAAKRLSAHMEVGGALRT
jgi:hypothetical protein